MMSHDLQPASSPSHPLPLAGFPNLGQRVADQLRRVPGTAVTLAVCALALAARLLIAATTHGSNDIETWQYFGKLVSAVGVLPAYELDSSFNHPPLMGWYAAAVQAACYRYHLPFDFLFKILPVVASTSTVFMAQKLGKLKLLWLILFAFSPTDVLISAYHGNTDSMCAAFCVGSLLFAEREQPRLSGLFLGFAINVKLIPVILIVPLALSFPFRRSLRFLAALGVCALPFVPVLLGPWQAFQQNAIAYNSLPARWGLGLIDAALDGRLQSFASRFADLTTSVGKPLILAASVGLGLLHMRWRLFSRAELCALALSCFLVFAPGFGPQYLIYATAFFAVLPGARGFPYVYLSGAFCFLIYYGYWTGTMPAFSDFELDFDLRTTLVGFLLWIWLSRYLLQAARITLLRLKHAALGYG